MSKKMNNDDKFAWFSFGFLTAAFVFFMRFV